MNPSRVRPPYTSRCLRSSSACRVPPRSRGSARTLDKLPILSLGLLLRSAKGVKVGIERGAARGPESIVESRNRSTACTRSESGALDRVGRSRASVEAAHRKEVRTLALCALDGECRCGIISKSPFALDREYLSFGGCKSRRWWSPRPDGRCSNSLMSSNRSPLSLPNEASDSLCRPTCETRD